MSSYNSGSKLEVRLFTQEIVHAAPPHWQRLVDGVEGVTHGS